MFVNVKMLMSSQITKSPFQRNYEVDEGGNIKNITLKMSIPFVTEDCKTVFREVSFPAKNHKRMVSDYRLFILIYS